MGFFDVTPLLDYAREQGPSVFFLLNAALSVVPVPGSAAVLCTAAGALYGVLAGMAMYVASATAGALAALLLSRSALAPVLLRLLSKHAKKIKALDAAVTKDGFQLVTLLRAAVVMPFQVVSVMLGFTSVPLGTYALGTAAGLVPSSLPYLYAGSLSSAPAGDADGGLVQLACNGLGLVATILVMYKVGTKAQAALDDAMATSTNVRD